MAYLLYIYGYYVLGKSVRAVDFLPISKSITLYHFLIIYLVDFSSFVSLNGKFLTSSSFLPP